jgi:NAD(P)-dependent dehydrogenase (short-subunit alcohol dehydrogenase family)
MQIGNTVFLVAGGASGLGAATARLAAEAGTKVVIADVQVEPGTALAGVLGPNAIFVKCDVTSEADGKAAVAAALERFGALHVLVNCAGVGNPEKTAGKDGPHDLARFVRVININLIGTFNMARLAADAMRKGEPNDQGERGVIINTASVAAWEGQVGQVAYASSKGGIVAMTLTIARDLARDGIRCMTIAPGTFETPLLARLPQETRDSLARQVPFPSRLGRPEEYAHLVRHVVENVMLNGETIRLDGAIRMAPR